MLDSIAESFPIDGKSIVYLGGPYTHNDQDVKLARFERITQAAAKLIEHGYVVYSPLTMTHPIDVILAGEESTLGSDYWVAFDEAFMQHCCGMIVLQIDGWKESSGIKREVDYFDQLGQPVLYLTPEEFGI